MNGENGITLEKQPGVPTAAPPAYQQTLPHVVLKPTYTNTDRVFAIAALVCGYMVIKTYIESLDRSGLGLMASVVSLGVTLYNFIYCRRLGMRGSMTTRVIFAVNLLLSLAFLFCDNAAVTMIAAPAIFAGNAYFSYACYREGSRSVIHIAFRALVSSPLYNFGSLFGALFKKPEKGAKGAARENLKNSLPIILGVVMSIPVCVIVAALLGSADAAFGSLFSSISLDDISNWIEDHVVSNIFIMFFSIPLSMYIFAAPFSRSVKMKNEDIVNKAPQPDRRILPASMCAAFLTPLTLLYVIFTALQVIHVFNAGVLSEPDFSYAEYARSGFFQLCAVALINLAVISLIMFFAKKDGSAPIRVFIIIFCLLTHCLIMTALAKMLLYIRIYGMTPKRVETTVFMVYLFVMFAVLIVKQFKSRLSFTKLGYCLASAVLIVLSFLPADRLTAQYNLDHYRAGDIEWMGYSAMCDLDATAAPVFAGIRPDDGAAAWNDAKEYFGADYYSDEDKNMLGSNSGIYDKYAKMTGWDFNIPRKTAYAAYNEFNKYVHGNVL